MDGKALLPQDYSVALNMYVKAAVHGHLPAQYRLGSAYEYGQLGCIIDPKKSIAWYSRAAEKGKISISKRFTAM